jgi:hypothetical protein
MTYNQSCATCLLLFLVALIAGYKKRRCSSRAQKLVLACGYFDEAGRIMLATEGALPIQKIADHYMDEVSLVGMKIDRYKLT